MTYPLYRDSATLANTMLGSNSNNHQENVGLLFTRFYSGFNSDWSVEKESKKRFIETAARIASNASHIKHIQSFAARQKQLCLSLNGDCMILETTGPFVTGSGISHPVENGFTFHPTLGLPYLPAAGVKGLLRAWVEVWMVCDSTEERQALITEWFGSAGSAAEGGEDARAGSLVFFDALPSDAMSMHCDIMTPHMGNWYEQGASISADNFDSVAPGDWHSPVPVPFLVVSSKVQFQWSIAPRLTGEAHTDAARKNSTTKALQALKDALEWIGAGAKTAVGYGRMVDTKAEREQATAQEFKNSGITVGETEWPTAKVSWDKGRAEIKVSYGQETVAPLSQQAARDMRAKLTEADQKKLDKGKPVTALAKVKITGNLIVLQSLQSLG